MAGRHEPPSRTSFYLSLGTAALRGILVVAALALGFFVLSQFVPSTGPSSSSSTPPAGTETLSPTTESPGTQPETSPTRNAPEPRDPSEVSVQVLNATSVSGLAADAADILEQAGYDVVTVDDATGSYDRSTIFYRPKAKADAQALQQTYFSSAVLEVAEPDIPVDITVTLAQDYADLQEGGGGGGGGGASPEESPT